MKTEQFPARHETRELTRSALAALRDIPGLNAGPLSPLARIAAADTTPDTTALVAALDAMPGVWSACPSALIDPRLSLAVIVADRRVQQSGQYVWADACGRGPGFRVEAKTAVVEVTGPIHLEELEELLLERLSPAGVATPEPVRLQLDAAAVWGLLALVDAHGTASLIREAARADGPLPALQRRDLQESWQLGLSRPNPGWAVSMAALLAPDLLPTSADAALVGLSALEEAGLLTPLAGKPDDPLGELLLPGGVLELLCDGLGRQSIRLGLLRMERSGPAELQIIRVMVWRLAGGYVLLDLSALAEDRAELLLFGASRMLELLGEMLGMQQEAASLPAAPTPTPVELRKALMQVATASSPAVQPRIPATPRPSPARPTSSGPRYCSQCGAEVNDAARFCGSCGARL